MKIKLKYNSYIYRFDVLNLFVYKNNYFINFFLINIFFNLF